MFIFGENRDSPDTITHSVSSPFEMPTMFDNSTSTIPLDHRAMRQLFNSTPETTEAAPEEISND